MSAAGYTLSRPTEDDFTAVSMSTSSSSHSLNAPGSVRTGMARTNTLTSVDWGELEHEEDDDGVGHVDEVLTNMPWFVPSATRARADALLGAAGVSLRSVQRSRGWRRLQRRVDVFALTLCVRYYQAVVVYCASVVSRGNVRAVHVRREPQSDPRGHSAQRRQSLFHSRRTGSLPDNCTA